MRRVGASADLVDGKIGGAELMHRGNDRRACFIAGLAAGSYVGRKSDGMVADVGRVVAGGAGAGDGCRIAERRIVIKAADAGDDERLRVEDLFAGGDLTLHLLAGFAGRGQLPWEVRVRGDVFPCGVEREDVLVEVDADGIAGERVVDAGRVFLRDEVDGATGGGASGE